MFRYSPLRYPGGKGRVSRFVQGLAIRNGLVGGHYVEPFAGGASVALSMLYAEVAEVVHINDVDPGVFSFWDAVLNHTARLCRDIRQAPMTVDFWREQRTLYREAALPCYELGFATFFLNRTNRSGIIGNGGLIGGLEQSGQWKMDARYNAEDLVERVERVAMYGKRIQLTRLDAADLLRECCGSIPRKSLVYLDPPYYVKGQGLYPNFYAPSDHAVLTDIVASLDVPWLVSYDNVAEIRKLYDAYQSVEYSLRYSAATRCDGGEIMFFSDGLSVPDVESPARVTRTALARMCAV